MLRTNRTCALLFSTKETVLHTQAFMIIMAIRTSGHPFYAFYPQQQAAGVRTCTFRFVFVCLFVLARGGLVEWHTRERWKAWQSIRQCITTNKSLMESVFFLFFFS
jgi:hypothetical protein